MTLKDRVAAIEAMSARERKAEWHRRTGTVAPPAFGSGLLARAIAQQLQEAALGGLSKADRKRLITFGNERKFEPVSGALSHTITLSIAASQSNWGHEPRLRLDPPAGSPVHDTNLVQLIARGFAARDQLLAMTEGEVRTMPTTQLRHLERIARLAYLAPDIIKAILDGRQPRPVTARFLSRLGALPLAWTDQRTMLGFASN